MKTFISFFLIAFIFCINVSFYFAQEKSKAMLIDQFGPLNCEDILNRHDGFLVELQNSPDSVGYIINKGLARERLLKGIAELRRFDKNRLVYIRAKEEEDLRTQFWIVPAGADKPEFEEAKWDLTFSKNQKPFIYYSSNSYDEICPTGVNLETYSEYLTENPKSRANIVIYAKSKTKFQKEKKEFSEELTENYKISPKRIRFFFVRDTVDYKVYEYNPDYKSYELWLLP